MAFAGIKSVNLGKMLDQSRHAEKIARERAESFEASPNASPLPPHLVTALEDVVSNNDFRTKLPLSSVFAVPDLFDLWSRVVATRGFSPVGVFAICLNSLLGDKNESVRRSVKARVFESVAAGDKYVLDALKDIQYYRDSYEAIVFENVNMLRDENEVLVEPNLLKTLAPLKLAEPLIESAIRFEDINAINHCLIHMVDPYRRNETLRKCLRINGVSKEFSDKALSNFTSVGAFASDLIALVKAGSISQIERVYNRELIGQCFHKLIMAVMDDSYLKPEGIEAAQRLVSMIIEDGFDVYPTFVERYCGTFGAIDQMARPRLTPHEILDRICARQSIGSSSSLDVFIQSISIDDISTHPKASELFDKMHKATKNKYHLKYASNKHKGQHLSNELGL